MAFIENTTREILVEKMIAKYIPTPAVIAEGEFRYIYINEVKNLVRINPFAAVVSLYRNALIGRDYVEMKELKEGKISWNEFKRKYIERLNMPDAIKEIARLRKLKTTQDIYITSFERHEEFSLRKLFCDYVNGKLIWN
jgi:uncharacterized protein YeaO (DUF488 family)